CEFARVTTHAKTSSSKDDAPFLIVSNDDEGSPSLSLSYGCYASVTSTISAITPPAWEESICVIEKDDVVEPEVGRLPIKPLDFRVEGERVVIQRSFPYAAIENIVSFLVMTLGSLVGKLVSSLSGMVMFGSFEQANNDLATATFLWLDEFVADPSAAIEALLSKKPPNLQRTALLRTQVPLPSSQMATLSSVPVSNLTSPPADAFVVKPKPSQLH
ncbi:hypothetical protein Tco_1011008, partial [Tanacetum coccineum]